MNKNHYLILITLILFVINSRSQTPTGIRCGTKDLSKKEAILFRESLVKIEELKKSNQQKAALPTTPYIIPVVFHILNDGSNINNRFTKAQMKSRIDDAIDVCNKDFKGLYPGFNNTNPLFNSVKSTLNILFVAATLDPDGNLLEIPGMNWHPELHIVDGYDSRIYNHMYYGKNGKYYLDVVVVDEPNPADGVYGSGHAFLPVQNVVPHVSYNHRYIGSVAGSNADFQFAKEMSHEFGHYFGLQHTFQGGCDPINDGMADTPPTTSAFGCNLTTANTCGVVANYENLMDYNVNCQAMFTRDQTNAMTFWLEDITASYPRRHLWQSTNLIATGVQASTPIANFSANTTAICANNSITFKDISLGIPSSRVWSFQGGTPATSTSATPTITYPTPGIYTVALTVTNALGNNTKTTVSYIKVGQATTGNYTENFSGNFPPNGWLITNPDNYLTWEKRNDIGNGDTKCMIMNNSDNSVLGALDYIQLPYYNFTSGVNSQLYFDVAYTKYDNNSPDVLNVEVSTNCGASWTSIYSKTHTILETTDIPTDLSNSWKPTTEANWRKEVINLSAYIGNPNVTFRFKNTSGFGTRIWIDNVNVAIIQSSTPVSDFASSKRITNCSTLSVPFLDVSTGNPTSWSWSFPGGTPSTSTVQNPTVTYNTSGSYTATLTTTNAAGTGTTVTKPNFIILVTPTTTTFTESFEGTFVPNGWEIKNTGDNITWEKRANVGHNSSSCMVINNADNAAGDVDELLLKPLNMSTGLTDFSFDVAYAKYDNVSIDKLDVLISTDCGTTWTNLYSKQLSDLETAIVVDNPATPNVNEINDWVPTLDSHWRTERILLNNYRNQPNVLVKFVNTSGYGSRIWIDNVNFTFDSHERPFSDFKSTQATCINIPVSLTDTSSGAPTSWLWSFPGGIPSSSTLQNPTVTYNVAGNYNVTLIATNAYGIGTTTVKSNFIKIKGKSTLPFSENFAGAFPIQDWEVINPDYDVITWEKRSDVGNGDLSCMIINNADNPTNKIDEIVLKPIDFSSATTPYLHFDLAYTQYFNATDPAPAPDKIDILVSSNCGATWTNVYSKNQIQLQTVNPPIQDNPATTNENETNDWKPTTSTDWRNELVNLSAVANQQSVLIKFKNTSGYGTRVWFDNININNSPVLNTKDETIESVAIYPNPSKDSFNLTLPLSNEEYVVTVHNILGQLILKTSFSGSNTNPKNIDLSGKEIGVYFLKLESSSKKVITKKLIKM